MSKSAEVLAVVVPPALVLGWAATNASCKEAAVELLPALVPGWADKTATAGWADVISTDEALPWSNWSILESGQVPQSLPDLHHSGTVIRTLVAEVCS